MYQSIGSALEIELEKEKSVIDKYVFRSVNRGGGGCGVYTVPRSNKNFLYIGAGSYVSKLDEITPKHRLETINYLFDLFKKRNWWY